MTHAELNQIRPELAQRAIELYYESNWKQRTHLCGLTLTGECNYASFYSQHTRYHTKRHHSRAKKPVPVYKITEYPPERIWFAKNAKADWKFL